MQGQDHELGRLVALGTQALQQGRAADAKRHLETAGASPSAGAQVWLLLAFACRALEDDPAEEQALDRLLALVPTSILGLILKGDLRVRAGNEALAVELYRNALKAAQVQAAPISQGELTELQRAETVLKDLDAKHAADLEQGLAERGFSSDSLSPRVRRSLDIMAGRSRAYFQDPRGYYFPELPQVQFYERERFEWTAAIEAQTSVIRKELLQALDERLEGFLPYIRSKPYEPRDHPLLDRLDWSVLFLCENGTRFDDAMARFPRTWEALQSVPLTWIERSSPTVMFSLLRAGARIPPHHGVHNARLICHLPLVVPPNCGFRVGNEVRTWEPGKLLIFDDSIEHEAWNESDEDRLVLIFDIWRPELTEQERREVEALLLLSLNHPQD